MAHARKDTVIDGLRGKLEEACAAAASEAVSEEHERAMELSKRLRREIARKDEMLKAHDGRLEALRDELDAGRVAVAAAEKSRERAWALAGSEATALRKRSVAMLSGVRSLAARLLRLSAAVGHTVGAASRADHPTAGPVETGIAELVDMEPDEVADLLGADDKGSGGGGGGESSLSPPPRVGRAASPASFAAIVSAMDAKANELELALSFPDEDSKRASAAATSSPGADRTGGRGDAAEGSGGKRGGQGQGSDEPSASASSSAAAAAAKTGGIGMPSPTDRWRDEALRFIVEAAEAEAEHAEAALKAAVPAMHEWWIQVMSAGGVAPPADGRKGKHARHTEGRASSRKRDEAARKGDIAGVRDSWPMGREGEMGSRGMRAKLAGAAALLASNNDED